MLGAHSAPAQAAANTCLPLPRARRLLDCQQSFTAASVLLVQQRFLLPLLLQELCTTLKLVVLRFTRAHSFSHLGLSQKQARQVTMASRSSAV